MQPPRGSSSNHKRQASQSDHLPENHQEVTGEHDIPYEHAGYVATGGHAVVNKVKNKEGRFFALKIFRKRNEDFQSVKAQFFNEIRIARKLQTSKHVTKIIASFSWDKELVLVIEPLANGGSLEDYLDNVRSPHDWTILRRGFGCLSNALAFIHRTRIRHKDISLSNILVHQNELIFSDFGISLDCSDSRVTTDGIVTAHNPMWCAPEVIANNGKRNFKSDIWSLGAVFCAIILKLEGFPYKSSCYSDQIDYCIGRLNSIQSETLPDIIYMVTARMLSKNSVARPTAKRICRLFADSPLLFCDECYSEVKTAMSTKIASPSPPDDSEKKALLDIVERETKLCQKIFDQAVALYPFKAEEEGELALEKGDVIAVMRRTAKPSIWWFGRTKNGRVGAFPSERVKMISESVIVESE